MVSDGPPGGYGKTMRIGLEGKACAKSWFDQVKLVAASKSSAASFFGAMVRLHSVTQQPSSKKDDAKLIEPEHA